MWIIKMTPTQQTEVNKYIDAFGAFRSREMAYRFVRFNDACVMVNLILSNMKSFKEWFVQIEKIA